MGFFGSFMGTDQRRDAKRAYADSNAMMDQGYGTAQGNLTQGYGRAMSGYDAAAGAVKSGYATATNALTRGSDKAAGYWQPYAQSGTQANALYDNALGLNGKAAQQTFMQGYAGADPFRASNADFANEALMRQLNARGMSGSGTAAAAIAQESLRRGSEDYNNHLNRLQGVTQQGMQAASGLSGIYANQGQNMANLAMQQGSDLANIQGQKAALGYNLGTAQAGLNTGLADAKAGNRINLGNALAASRNIGMNNLLQLGGLAVKAYGGGFGGMGGGYTGSIAGGA